MASRSTTATKEPADKRITYRHQESSFDITQGIEQCRIWVEKVSGVPLANFEVGCKNGVALCK